MAYAMALISRAKAGALEDLVCIKCDAVTCTLSTVISHDGASSRTSSNAAACKRVLSEFQMGFVHMGAVHVCMQVRPARALWPRLHHWRRVPCLRRGRAPGQRLPEPCVPRLRADGAQGPGLPQQGQRRQQRGPSTRAAAHCPGWRRQRGGPLPGRARDRLPAMPVSPAASGLYAAKSMVECPGCWRLAGKQQLGSCS